MNIIITGASTGIGYETAKRFAEEAGHTIYIIARREDRLKELASHATRSSLIPVVTDLATYDFSDLIGAMKSEGSAEIDILINNAGVLINKPFESITAEEWESLYGVNIIGTSQLIRVLLPYMGQSRTSHIVNMSSMGGVNGSLKFPGLSAYSSSKGALCTLTECLAEEFKTRNIKVNCLALGAVQTEMLTKAFPGYAADMMPEELSRFIFDFCKTGWKYFNGKILEVSTTNP